MPNASSSPAQFLHAAPDGARAPGSERAKDEVATVGPNGELQRLSVSTLKKGKECLRRFWWNKVKHLPEPQFAAQELGVEGHAQLEHLVKTGEDVLGPIARPAKALLPTPAWAPQGKAASLAEGDFRWSIDGVPVSGFIDLLTFTAPRVLRVTDYKFTGDPKAKWNVREPSELVDVHHPNGHGIQMIGYAVAVADRWPGLERIEVEHIQIGTKKREAYSKLATIEPDEARARWEQLVPLVRDLKAAAKATDVSQVKPTWTACGRCPFRTQCFSALTQPGEKKMGILDLVLSNPTPAAPPPAIVKPPVDVSPAIVNPPPAIVKPALITEVCACGAELSSENSSKLQSGERKHIGCSITPVVVQTVTAPLPGSITVAQVLPPDAPKSDPALAAVDPKPAEEKAKRTRRTKEQIEADERAEAERLAAKFGCKVVGLTSETPPPSVVVPLAPEKGAELGRALNADSTPTEVVISPRGLRLFVDCFPNIPAKDLDGYVEAMVQKTAKAAGVDDLRLVLDKHNPIAFGQWRGALAQAVKAEPPTAGDYIVTSSTGEFTQVVIEALKPLCSAGNFVRGIR